MIKFLIQDDIFEDIENVKEILTKLNLGFISIEDDNYFKNLINTILLNLMKKILWFLFYQFLKNNLEDFLIVDIVKFKDDFEIIEINCFNTSGTYDIKLEDFFLNIIKNKDIIYGMV